MLHHLVNWLRPCLQQISSYLVFPFEHIFFPPSFPKTFLERSYFRLSTPTQHRRSRRRCVASHTAPFTLSLHSIHPKNFAGVPPRNRFQLIRKFIPCERKLCNLQSLRFVDTQLTKTAELSSFAHTNWQLRVAAHSKRFAKTCPKQHVQRSHSHKLRRTNIRNNSPQFSRPPRWVQETTVNIICNQKLPVRSVPNAHIASYWQDQAGRSPQAQR